MGANKILSFTITNEFLVKAAGERAPELVNICDSCRSEITDEKIGKKMKDLKITEIRTILNKLHYWGIAHYQKTRDAKTGWYSYSWQIKVPRIAALILEGQCEEIGKLENTISLENDYMMFACKRACDSAPFEIAAEYQFVCPNCGGTMAAVDNKKRVRGMKKRLEVMKCEMKTLEGLCKKHNLLDK